MKNTPEDDPVWDLLDNASSQEASETFSRDVMRSIRLDADVPSPWWKRLLSPAPALATLATAAACVALVINSQTPTTESPKTLADNTPRVGIEDSFAELAASYESSGDLDELISPIPLVASSTSMNDLAFFIEL